MTRKATKLWLVTDRVPWFVEAKERGGGKGARNSWNVTDLKTVWSEGSLAD
jgi:hypothetical protein